MDTSLDGALRQFEATAANLAKLDRLWRSIEKLIPEGIVYDCGSPDAVAYGENCRAFRNVLAALPAINGWRPDDHLVPLNSIAKMRSEARDEGEIDWTISVEERVFKQGDDLRDYRFKLGVARRELTRPALFRLLDAIDENVRSLPDQGALDALGGHIAQIDILLGSESRRPGKWTDLQRHVRFGEDCDILDIKARDWPAVKSELTKWLSEGNDALPVEAMDLAALVKAKPRGPVATKLKWGHLTAETFERLVYCLISSTPSYENPEWLTATNAPDRGRDLSVTRVQTDLLCGTRRDRVIIQCKHWTTTSVPLKCVTEARDQMALWEPPRVNVLVIASTGRFTTDAIACIETHNQSNVAMRIEMWPESHLELLLAARPDLLAEFDLR